MAVDKNDHLCAKTMVSFTFLNNSESVTTTKEQKKLNINKAVIAADLQKNCATTHMWNIIRLIQYN